MRRVMVIAALSACGTRSTNQGGSSTADAAEAKIASARRAWLGGDLDGAIADLTAAHSDPALALLARAYEIAGKPAEVARTLALRPPAQPEIAIDTARARAMISPDGAYVATFDSASRYASYDMTVWDTLTGRPRFMAKGLTAAFGVTPKTGVTWVVSPDPSTRTKLRAWDAATGVLAWTVDVEPQEIYQVAIDQRGVITATTKSRVLAQYDLATGAKLRELATNVPQGPLQISRDASVLFVDDQLLETQPGSGPVTVVGRAQIPDLGRAISEVLSPDGDTLAIASATGEIFLDDRRGHQRAHVDEGRGGVRLAFAPGNVLIAIDKPHHVRRFDALTGKLLDETELPDGLTLTSAPDMPAPSFSASGHMLVPQDGGYVVVAIGKGTARVISRFGAMTRATALDWSPDGTQLAIMGSRYAGFVWTPSTGALAVDPPGNDGRGQRSGQAFHTTNMETAPFNVTGNRVWVYDGADGRVQHYVEASSRIAAATRAGDLVVAADATGQVHLWSAATGEGLGGLGTGAAGEVTAIALAPDGHTLAVARDRGGIEMWDVPSRSHLADLAPPTTAAGGAMTTVTDDGRWDGDASALVWRTADVDVDASPDGTFAAGTATSGLATLALAKRPAPRVVAHTPAVKPLMPGCLPPDAADLSPVNLALAGDTLTLCERHGDRDPYCFEVSLAAETTTPIATPIAVIAPPMPHAPHETFPTARPSAYGVQVCSDAGACREVAMRFAGGELALSKDGTLLAVEPVSHGQGLVGTVATYDTATGKQIARFAVHYGTRAEYVASWGESLAFLGHTLLAIDVSCLGPCGTATMYSARGRKLGELVVEASTVEAIPVGGERFLVKSYGENAFTIQDAATGAIVATSRGDNHSVRDYVGITGAASATSATADDALPWDAVVADGKIVRVLGTNATGEGGKVMVHSLDGKLSSEFSIPRCAASGARATKTALR